MFGPDSLRAAVVEPLAGARLAVVDAGHESRSRLRASSPR